MKKAWLVLLSLAVLLGLTLSKVKTVSSKSPKGLENKPLLEKRVFIHYRKGYGRPPWAGGGKGEGGPKCYDFLSKGAKLKKQKDLTIHPGLDTGVILASAEAWDSNTPTALFGSYTTDPNANWDSEAPDGRNEFSYDDYPAPGVIAVTIAWGYFSGPPSFREILEFDVLFDTDFTWGDAIVDPVVMDLQNIATHEIGHGVGLGDLYQSDCSEVTMYGYSNYGETKKRTLESQDIKGLQELYEE